MVSVKYVGSEPAINIRLGFHLERGWKQNEVRELSNEHIRFIESNPEFEVVGAVKKKEIVTKAPVVEEEYEDVLLDDEEEYIEEE